LISSFFFLEKKNLIKYIYAYIIYVKSFYHYNKMKNLFLFLFFFSLSLSILFDYQHTYFCFLFLIVYIFIWYNWNNFNIFLTNKLFQEDYCLIKYIYNVEITCIFCVILRNIYISPVWFFDLLEDIKKHIWYRNRINLIIPIA